MELLERDGILAALGDYAADAVSGSGRLVVVTGEAGIGKTSLVDAFRATRDDLRWLWGACDGGFTPRPLGPVYDLAADAGGGLRDLLAADVDRNELFTSFVGLLAEGPPTGVVVEDLHWGDEATLDLLSHVSRRLGRLPALVLVTCRDDEAGRDGALADVLGRFASHGTTRRVAVPRLSARAVARLAETRAASRDVPGLHALTGGNPFLVHELLAIGEATVPPSVADIARARLNRHSPGAQRILAAAAVLARPAPAPLLAAVAGVAATAVDECVSSGALVVTGTDVAFRHELTRRATLEAVPPVRAIEMHRIALLALEREDADDAELAHHAVGCGDAEAILVHSRRAGHAAAAASSHREAVVHFRDALVHAERLPDDEHADLEEAAAESLAVRDHWAEAEPHWQRSIALRRRLGDPVALSRCLRRLSTCMWRLCRNQESLDALHECFDLMRDTGDSAEKALVLWLYANTEEVPAADRRAAIDESARIAKALGDEALIARARFGQAFSSPDGTVDFGLLEEALEHALRAGDSNLVAGIYTNRYESSIDMLRLDAYTTTFEDDVTYCLEHEQHTYSVCMRGSRVTELMRRGDNDQAITLALTTMQETISPVNRMHLGIGLTMAGFRLGRPEARAWLKELWELGLGNGEVFWLTQVATAAVQGAWLTGDTGLVDARVQAVLDLGPTDDVFIRGDLECWLARVGRAVDAGERPPPYSLELAGDHLAAAAAWRDLGCPFEEAVALTSSGEEASLRRALEIFAGLGTLPAVAVVRRELQRLGVRTPLPRGPRAATAAHPDGLTRREAEVLDLLREGLTNADIAQRLYLSIRTVDHHVSAILAKLGVTTRAEAADLAAARS